MAESPKWVAKVQILLGAAAGAATTIAAIPWPGKSAAIGTVAGYGAAACAGIAAAIQFLRKAEEEIESTNTPAAAPAPATN